MKFYGVIVGESTSLYGAEWDFGRLDQATAERKADRLAAESREPVYVLEVVSVACRAGSGVP